MTSRSTLDAVAAIERVRSADALSTLLEAVDLPAYGDYNPRMAGQGNTADSIERVSRDVAGDPIFDHSILIGALVHIVSDQQRRLDALEAKLSSRSTKTKKAPKDSAA